MKYRVGRPFWRQVARAGVPVRLRVEVHFDEESNSYWASSDDLDGLVVAGDTLDELRSEVVSAATVLLEMELAEAPRHVTADMHMAAAVGAA